MIHQLPIDQIDTRKDARAVDTATVAGLAESISAVGLINPIRVRECGGRWEVIAGVHRLTACKQIGRDAIEAVVVTDDDLHAELAMIDENLCRAELSPSDRAKQTARRKAIYLELHPETAKEAFHGNQHVAADNLSVASFAVETAKAIGKDERSVRRDAERGEKVIDEVVDLIRGTKLDTGTYLDKLKKLPPNDQVAAAKRDLAQIRAEKRKKAAKRSSKPAKKLSPAAPSAADAPTISFGGISEGDPRSINMLGPLLAAWDAADGETRAAFLKRIGAVITEMESA